MNLKSVTSRSPGLRRPRDGPWLLTALRGAGGVGRVGGRHGAGAGELWAVRGMSSASEGSKFLGVSIDFNVFQSI